MLRESSPASPRAPGNFGAARLALALCVIIGHTPELHDGNRHREPLTALFGTLSLGEAAVFGFFLLSGYLLTASLQATPDLRSYAVKRIARIYPGFLLAALACLVLVAPVAGGTVVPDVPLRLLFLLPPNTEGAFAGLHYPSLNGALWTLHHEAGCYVLLAALFAFGTLRRPRVVIAVTAGLLAMNAAVATPPFLHLLAAFMTGVSARLTLRPADGRPALALAAAAGLGSALTIRVLAEPAVILFGGYLLFWFCERRSSGGLSRIGQRMDLSYGIYLYAWPIQNLLIWRFGLHDLFAIAAITTAVAAMAAVVSWFAVERPAMRAAASLVARWPRRGERARYAIS